MDRVVIVGAGAAGLVAAWHAAAGARDVVLLERTPNGARKILISGGGRCNILPSSIDASRFVTSSSAHSLRKMLTSWPLPDLRQFFEREIGIELRLEEETGKLFPASDSAHEVRERLFESVEKRGVDIRMTARVESLERKADGWTLGIGGEGNLRATTVLLATGGLSVPGTGSDGIGLRLARQLGHEIRETAPALTPLLTEDRDFRELAGISLVSELCCGTGKGRLRTNGGFLFTHRGFSGPAVLDLAHRLVADPQTPLHINWNCRSAADWDAFLQAGRGARLRSGLRADLPERLVDVLLRRAQVDGDSRMADLSRQQRLKLLQLLTDCPLNVVGHEGYSKAEVTSGGIALGEVDPRTMQSRRVPGLYFCGEILDAFGPIGGHNFAWAFATGRLAGMAVAG
jgi:predicted Rossmann fold flavoprotein